MKTKSYLNTTLCIGSIENATFKKNATVEFKYNTLYRFNDYFIEDFRERAGFKYNTLYRFNREDR